MKNPQSLLRPVILLGLLSVLVMPTGFAEETDEALEAAKKDIERLAKGDTSVFTTLEPGFLEKRALKLATGKLALIGECLMDFDEENGGRFPGKETIAGVRENTGSTARMGAATANECFYQLYAAGIIASLEPFTWNERVPRAEKNPEKLEKCDFTYLAGLSAKQSPACPVVLAPVVKGKKVFDPKVFGGKALVLFSDKSVHTLPIAEGGTVSIDGKDIFDPAQPFWKSKVADIKWPE